MLKIMFEYYYDKDYKAAIELGNELLEKTSKEKNYYTKGGTYSLLGNSLLQNGDTIAAKDIFKKAIENARKSKLDVITTTASIDLANILALTGNYTDAIKSYKQIIPLAIKAEDDATLFIIYYNIAESYLELEKFEYSEEYLERAQVKLTNLAIAYQASFKVLKGKYYQRTGDYNNSVKLLEEAKLLSEKADYREALVECLEYLTKSHELLGNYQKAYETLKELDTNKKVQYDEDKINAIETATAKFNYDQVQQELENARVANKLQRKLQSRKLILITTGLIILSFVVLTSFLFINQQKRKRLLNALQVKNEELENAVTKSNRMRAAKDVLFSKISHELRTPMYGIVGMSTLMLEKEAERNVSNIKSLKYSGDYLLNLINNVLEMNKKNRVRDDSLVLEEFDVREVCNFAMNSISYMSHAQFNTYSVHIDKDIPTMVTGDKTRLSQVLINLLGNASKFTKNGLITLTLTLENLTDCQTSIRFEVKDTGIGIAPERQKQVLEESEFINHNHQNEGTGLGLPISKHIIELHGSKLELESVENVGTTIYFEVCYDYVKVEPKKEEANSNSTNIKDREILVVDDNRINQVVTKKILENLGAKVTLGDSGQKAVDLAKEQKFGLIFMDINMPPGMDGFEAAALIREFDLETPIIALTAVEQAEMELRIADSQLNDFVIKPFNKDKFLSLLEKYL
jgi:signal transduction histidine kinase